MLHGRTIWILSLLLLSIGCSESAAVDDQLAVDRVVPFTPERTATVDASAVAQASAMESADSAPQVESPASTTTAAPAAASSPAAGATPDLAATATVATRIELRERYAEYELVTLLPRDAIPAIDDPAFLSVEEADDWYDPDELVMGVVFGGEARAYSVPLLSRHEIVNDTVGGVDIAVTW